MHQWRGDQAFRHRGVYAQWGMLSGSLLTWIGGNRACDQPTRMGTMATPFRWVVGEGGTVKSQLWPMHFFCSKHKSRVLTA